MKRIALVVNILISLVIVRASQAESFTIPHGKIAFQSNRDQVVSYKNHIYTMNTDGSNVKQLTTEGENWYPSFSPDGKTIAYCSYNDKGEKTGVYIMNTDGSDVHQLTHDITPLYRPAWSPDGKQLAITVRDATNGENEIYTINSDGTGLTNLTNSPANDLRPTWSPDGNYIVFGSSRKDAEHNTDNQLWIMNFDGTNLRKLTSIQNSATFPVWSPDGKFIVFTTFSEDAGGLYLINVEKDFSVQRLTEDFYEMASWSPDSRYIAIVSLGAGENTMEIGILEISTGKIEWLTNNEFDDSFPSWSPVVDLEK